MIFTSVKDVSYTVTRHGLLCCQTWCSHTGVDEHYALSTGEGSPTFRWNVVPSSWAAGPEDDCKLTSQQAATFQITCIFTNTTVRISQPPTVVPKRRQETTNRRCIKSQKSADLVYTAAEACCRVTLYLFLYFLFNWRIRQDIGSWPSSVSRPYE